MNVVFVASLVVVGGVVCFVVCVVGLVLIVVLLAIWRGFRPQMATNCLTKRRQYYRIIRSGVVDRKRLTGQELYLNNKKAPA